MNLIHESRTDKNPTDMGDIEPFHLVSVLQQRAANTKGKPKRLRTRAQIIAATASEMERRGYESLTVDQITETAGMARGTFYLYFDHRSDAAIVVMRSFQALLRKMMPRGGGQLPAMQAIRRANQYYVALYARNADLLAGRQALMRDRPELAAFRDTLNRQWALLIVRDLDKRKTPLSQTLDYDRKTLQTRSVIAMADELLREIFIYKSASLKGYIDNQEMIVDTLTDIWWRALYG